MGSALMLVISFSWQGYPTPHYTSTTIKACEHIVLVEAKSEELVHNNYTKEEDYYCIDLLKSK